MTSYLENKLELLNANQRKLDNEKRAIEEQIILEIEKKSALEMDGTIVKLETQVNELKKCIEGDIMPNNVQLVHRQLNTDFLKECNEFNTLYQSGRLSSTELEQKKLIIRQKKIELRRREEIGSRSYRNGYLVLSDDNKFITLEKFKDNLSKIDDTTIKKGLSDCKPWDKRLVEIKPEIKVYDDIIPIFSTMIGIMKKQQQEIKELQKN